MVEIGEAGGGEETRGIKGSAPRVFVSGEARSHCSSLAFCQRLSGFNNHKSGLARVLAGSSREENGGGKKNNPRLMIIKRGDKTKNVPELQI